MDDLPRRVYRAFDPAPLRPDQTNLYVNMDAARGAYDVVNRLAKKIRFADEPTCQVLAGHLGSGKSTELLRLQRDLESGNPPYFVVYFSADEDIDRNDVDFPEILIAIIRQLAAQFHDRTGRTLKPGYFKDRWERIKHLLSSEVEFEKAELHVGMAKL